MSVHLFLAEYLVSADKYEQGSKTHMGGTMRLGSRRTYFHVSDCVSAKLYVYTLDSGCDHFLYIDIYYIIYVMLFNILKYRLP